MTPFEALVQMWQAEIVLMEEPALSYYSFRQEPTPNILTKAFLTSADALQRQIPIPPIFDEDAAGIDDQPVLRCQACGYALDSRIKQYCPCCGQRLTEYSESEVEG